MSKYLIVAMILLVLLFVAIRSCQTNKQNFSSEQSYNSSKSDSLKSYINKVTNQLVVYKKASELNEKAFTNLVLENNDLKQKLSKYKNIKTVIETQTITKIDTLKFYFKDSIPCEFEPIVIKIDSSNYNLSGLLTNKDFVIQDLTIPNKQTIVIGEKKNGLFKKNEFVVSVENSNVLIKTMNVQSFSLKSEKKWYQTFGFQVGLGIISTLLVINLIK